jgi:hypothetical protein
MTRTEYIEYAKGDLELARREPQEAGIRRIENNLANAACKPEDIGSSQEELDELRRQWQHHADIKEMRRQGDISTARQILEAARNDLDPQTVDVVRDTLLKGGVEPEEIGTSWRELDGLRCSGHIAIAAKYLAMARREPHPEYLRNIKRQIVGFVRPADIGTTEDELEDLRCRGNLRLAKQYLEIGRKDHGLVEVARITGLLNGINADLKDIGTTEDELKDLQRKQNLQYAMQFLEMARRDHDPFAVGIVRTVLQRTGAIPEEIGTSQEELDQIRH